MTTKTEPGIWKLDVKAARVQLLKLVDDHLELCSEIGGVNKEQYVMGGKSLMEDFYLFIRERMRFYAEDKKQKAEKN
jgi:hypothetical protein